MTSTEWDNKSVVPWRPSHPALGNRRAGKILAKGRKRRRPKSARSAMRASDWRREAADYKVVAKGLQTPLDNITVVLAENKGFHFDHRLKNKQEKMTRRGGVVKKSKALLVPSRPSTTDGRRSRMRRRREPR